MESANAPYKATASSGQINITPETLTPMPRLHIEMSKGLSDHVLDFNKASVIIGAHAGITTPAEPYTEMPKEHGKADRPRSPSTSSYNRAPCAIIPSAEPNYAMPKGQAKRTIDDEFYESAMWWSECCIYEVPHNIRKKNSLAYTPQFVSIGPIHHKKKNLRTMENLKRTYLKSFQSRLIEDEASMDAYKNFLERYEQDIRLCYSKKYNDGIFKYQKGKGENQFVNMIMLDAVFIMELFLRSLIIPERCDHLLPKYWMMSAVKKDLLLLENQLPIFVLVELYNNFVPNFLKVYKHYSFHELAYKFFSNHLQQGLPISVYQESKHFTDMLRYTQLPGGYQHLQRSENECFHLLKTAVKLDEAGITLKKQEKYLGVQFDKEKFLNTFPFLSMIPWFKCFKACFRIPQIEVDDSTELLLRNTIALEQCHYPEQQHITSYITLMDRLIDTQEDARFLLEKGIINHTIGSNKEVASLFNNLLKDVEIYSEFYGKEMERIHEHCKNKWNLGMAKLKSVYFCSLWRGSLTVLGIVVFFFSIFNSIHSFSRNV